MNKVSELPNKELEYIWRLRHASDPRSLCAVVPLETYNRMYQTAKNHPQFVLPLPRPVANNANKDVDQASEDSSSVQNAVDVHFLQWAFHPPTIPPATGTKSSNTHTSTVIFTHLASFKAHGAYSRVHTTITHHLDLADSHGLVLLNGAVVDGGGVSAEEARWLLMCLQKFYDSKDRGGNIGKESPQRLLQMFSEGDQAFKLEDLVDATERIS
jgi:ATP synthase mitochondrial F1 complex assembly factor 1